MTARFTLATPSSGRRNSDLLRFDLGPVAKSSASHGTEIKTEMCSIRYDRSCCLFTSFVRWLKWNEWDSCSPFVTHEARQMIFFSPIEYLTVVERERNNMNQISVDVNIEVRFPRERRKGRTILVLDLHHSVDGLCKTFAISIARCRAPMKMVRSFLLVWWKGFHSKNDFYTSSRVWSMTAVRGQSTITFKIDLKT